MRTSEDTIRRDPCELALQGKLQRVHGGAPPAFPALAGLRVRAQLSLADKQALGRHGAAVTRPGQRVFLDGGITAIRLAPGLRATIATHSPQVAVELAAHPLVGTRVLGGRLRRQSRGHVGAVLIKAALRNRADLCFLGVAGVHPEAGRSTGDADAAAVKHAR